ncbi:DUF4238 domain-containing protein [Rhizobium ruizarguesonis]
MSITRNNHYVPQWYQEGFFEPGQNALACLDLKPEEQVLPDGRTMTKNSRYRTPTSRAFRQHDLYSTFFGTSVNDEIERKLFGDIDTRGSVAVRAFIGTDFNQQHRHFQTFFEYIDIQKIRTPKGLDWLRSQYPHLSQNELMMEMQGIRAMHCTIWTEGVREIVSAEASGIKFIVTDHPVTIYNHAAAPSSKLCRQSLDPSIALKGSQTIFPLNRDFCLILTNLEYARNPETVAVEKRTFARNFRQSMVRTDAFIRERRLSELEVATVNHVLKSRADRYVAAGKEEWLYPEKLISSPWSKLRHVLLPPKDGQWLFGGEMFAGFDSGHVHYQDEFGRTEKPREFLLKPKSRHPARSRDACGCGSGQRFGDCCRGKPEALRPAWDVVSIRERNLMFFKGIEKILGLAEKKDWGQLRRELSDEKISEVYGLFSALWPLETDMVNLLPKPDGTPRAVYTGSIHPWSIGEFALGASAYFGETLIEHPFLHADAMNKKFSPVENPGLYRQEFLKDLLFLAKVMPYVDAGLVNLVPDLCNFDHHLRDQMMTMAEWRTEGSVAPNDKRVKALMQADFRRAIMSLPREVLRRQIAESVPPGWTGDMEEMLDGIAELREADPLAVLHSTVEVGQERGQLNLVKLAPNFEMSMYLAQATGAAIITDSPIRWAEIKRAFLRGRSWKQDLQGLIDVMQRDRIQVPTEPADTIRLAWSREFSSYKWVVRDSMRYLGRLGEVDFKRKPNVESSLARRFSEASGHTQKILRKAGIQANEAKLSCLFPVGGIQDNTINRLLLMSSSESHTSSVPMAFFLQPDR